MVAIIVLILGLVIGYWYYLSYNELVSSLTATDLSWSNIEVELKRRFDLIDNLVAVTKAYVTHEQKTLIETVKARSVNYNLQEAASVNKAIPEIKDSFSKLMAIVEEYPDLKASEQFLSLQSELATSENRIAERRQAYNQCVGQYRNISQTFPTNLVYQVAGFSERVFFDAPDEVNAVTSVKLI